MIASDNSPPGVLLVNLWTIADDLGVEALRGEDGESVGRRQANDPRDRRKLERARSRLEEIARSKRTNRAALAFDSTPADWTAKPDLDDRRAQHPRARDPSRSTGVRIVDRSVDADANRRLGLVDENATRSGSPA
jgi:hypothetical protein